MATFREATDRLLSWGFTAEDLGTAAGVSANSILRARRSDGQSRPPPRNWRAVFNRMAQSRSDEAAALAAELADA